MKKIIDVTCGGKMMWFDKNNPHVIYSDYRTKPKGTIPSQSGWGIEPDVTNDFKNLQYADESFSLVVFDPPHILRRIPELGKFPMQYGVLHPDTWKDELKSGFNECWRVLKKDGVLIFKWNEANATLKEVLKCFSQKPLFGHTTAKSGKTKWICFMKL